jgi:hypothetical protein
VGATSRRDVLTKKCPPAGIDRRAEVAILKNGFGLFGEFDFGGGHLHFAVHFLDAAGGGDFFGLFANIIMELFADVVLDEIIVDGFAVFFDLNDVLAFCGFVEGAFAAFAVTGDGFDFGFGKGDGGHRKEHYPGHGGEN